jgi:putative ABC transport system permease protein
MLIKISSVDAREGVVSGLNSKGFRYQDYSQYKQYEKLESSLSTILGIGSIVFMVVTALFILINMAKFVSEGRKEIGIFRAIGATKGDIRLLFMTQSFQYIVLAIIGGIVFGVLGVIATSGIMATQAKTFINTAVGSSVIINTTLSNTDFMGFDFQTILLYALALIVITLIVALIPSSQAARVSPVEAIRN